MSDETQRPAINRAVTELHFQAIARGMCERRCPICRRETEDNPERFWGVHEGYDYLLTHRSDCPVGAVAVLFGDEEDVDGIMHALGAIELDLAGEIRARIRNGGWLALGSAWGIASPDVAAILVGLAQRGANNLAVEIGQELHRARALAEEESYGRQ